MVVCFFTSVQWPEHTASGKSPQAGNIHGRGLQSEDDFSGKGSNNLEDMFDLSASDEEHSRTVCSEVTDQRDGSDP